MLVQQPNVSVHSGGTGADQQRWPDLTGLRGLAIALVVGVHAHVPSMSGGLFGVDIFFVLSGYLITGQLARWTLLQGPRLRPWTVFLGRRVARLMPTYLATLVGLVAWSYYVRPSARDGKCLVSALTYTMNLPSGFRCLGPWHVMWSLAAEEQFYLLWPASLLLLARFRNRATVILGLYVLCVTVATFLAHMTPESAETLSYSPIGRSAGLLLGAFIALLPPDVKYCLPADLSAAALLTGLVVASFFRLPAVEMAPLIAVPAASMILGLRRSPSYVKRILSVRLLIKLGELSYCLYLVHVMLLWMARQYIGDTSPVAAILGTVGALGLAAVMHTLIEGPLRRKGNAALATFAMKLPGQDFPNERGLPTEGRGMGPTGS